MISFREFLLLENKPKITINDDLTVDVEGNVNISFQNLKLIPVQFGHVSGYFYCTDNKLTSLQGSPKEVGGDFWCSFDATKFTKEDVRKVSNVNGRIYV